jgi:hypothetical protein
MVGRWKSGAPLELAPLRDDPALGANEKRNNDFGYADDPLQRKCPYGLPIFIRMECRRSSAIRRDWFDYSAAVAARNGSGRLPLANTASRAARISAHLLGRSTFSPNRFLT